MKTSQGDISPMSISPIVSEFVFSLQKCTGFYSPYSSPLVYKEKEEIGLHKDLLSLNECLGKVNRFPMVVAVTFLVEWNVFNDCSGRGWI